MKTHLNQVRHQSERQNEQLCAVIGVALIIVAAALFVLAFAVADRVGI
jgi:uncharacterized membrane protein YidH (DUF202 family)